MFFEIQPVSGAVVAAIKHSLIANWTSAVKGLKVKKHSIQLIAMYF